MNPDHALNGDYRDRIARFGYTSVIKGCDEPNNERMKVELEGFVEAYNLATKRGKLNRPTLFLTEESMLFSIHPKSPVTSADLKKKK